MNAESDSSPNANPEPKDRPDKDFVELLTEELSWQTIRDVMTYDVNRPLSDKTTGDLADVALKRGWISKEQYRELRDAKDDVTDSMGKGMVDRGLISDDQLAEARDVMSRTGQPLWRTLLQLKMTLPQEVVEFLKSDIELPFGKRPNPVLCGYLVENEICTEEQLDDAWHKAKAAKTDFRRYLIDNGLATSLQIRHGEALELGFPFDDLSEVTEIPSHVLRMLPSGVMLRFSALPYKVENDRLFIAFSDARQAEGMNKLGLLLQMPVQPVLAPAERLEELLAAAVPDEGFKTSFLSKTEESGSHEAPAVEMLTIILRGLLNAEGSDAHIEPSKESARVRYRVDGILHDFMTLDLEITKRVSARLKSLAGMEAEQRFVPQDGHLNIRIDDAERNFRIATVPSLYGEKVAIRIVRNDMAFSTFAQLGMTDTQREVMNDLLNAPSGLVLTAGPVGSGKTTTLYSCLNCLDCFNQNIMTIEDPVEFELPGVTQVQVQPKRGLTFGSGVRALLRQDVDTLMIGEIRDEETAQIAVRAALSGTLVLSTVHANSATAAVAAMIQLGVSSFAVGNALTGVVFQRLVRRICPECRTPYQADSAEKQVLGVSADTEVTLYRGAGCTACFRTGCHGRIGVFEMVRVNEDLRRVIFSKPNNRELRDAAKQAGMIPLSAHVRELVKTGTISLHEMLRVT